jgi:hypothetical protein
MSKLNRPVSKHINDDIQSIHSGESKLYPGNIVSLEPIRTAVANKLSKALLLKQIEETLELYDYYEPADERNYYNELDFIGRNRNRSNSELYLPLSFTIAAVGLWTFRPFHLSSYLDNIKLATIVFGGIWLVWNRYFTWINNKAYKSLEQERLIVETKAELHVYSVWLTNELKYPSSDLH